MFPYLEVDSFIHRATTHNRLSRLRHVDTGFYLHYHRIGVYISGYKVFFGIIILKTTVFFDTFLSNKMGFELGSMSLKIVDDLWNS